MNDKAKSNSTITHRRVDGRIEFTVLGVGKFEFDPDKVSATNRARAMIHGFVQRISDGGALSRDPDTGLPATPQAKFDKMCRIRDHLESGAEEWQLVPAANPEANAGLVIRAMIALGKARDVDHAEARIEGLRAKHDTAEKPVDRKAAVKMLAATSDIGAKMIELRAADAAARAKMDSDELLDGIGDEEEVEEENEAA